jgi:hypothetical protein
VKKKEVLKVAVDVQQNYYVIINGKTPEITFVEAANVYHAFCVKFHYEKWIKGEDI